MPKNASPTQLKIRYGLILQGLFARALTAAKIPFDETPDYDSSSEVPDFLIPDSRQPKWCVEVHQTDARNHFQMKVLRSLTAVSEAKFHFGRDLISVNVLFGDPNKELPASNLRALCSIFDCSIIPMYQLPIGVDYQELETDALRLAGALGITTTSAAAEVAKDHSEVVTALGTLMKKELRKAKRNESIDSLWDLDRQRRHCLKDAPTGGADTFYKKNLIQSLLFADADFEELLHWDQEGPLDADLVRQLALTGVAGLSEDIDGDRIQLSPHFATFLRDPRAPALRAMCIAVLNREPTMRWFFEDVRQQSRRSTMADHFLETLDRGKKHFRHEFWRCFGGEPVGGIEHTRCWFADLMAAYVGQSHNYFNKKMFSHPNYSLTLGNPFNNITIRSSRLGKRADDLKVYADVCCDVFFDEVASLASTAPNASELAKRLLKVRLVASMRLQKLDPLILMVDEICGELGLQVSDFRAASLITDLSDDRTVARYECFLISDQDGRKKIALNAIAPDENPADKAKEWGARRFAMLYRYGDAGVVPSDYAEGIFVLDGRWEEKDIRRLHRSGWTVICRLGDLEGELRKIFGGRGRGRRGGAGSRRVAVVELEDEE